MTWLNLQHRDRYPKTLTVVEDATHLLPFGWVRIDATDRIASLNDALLAPQDEAAKIGYARLEAEIKDNRIEVHTQRVRRYTLFVNEWLVNVAHPIVVVTNGEISYHGPVTLSPRILLHEARVRSDPQAIYTSAISIDVVPGQ